MYQYALVKSSCAYCKVYVSALVPAHKANRNNEHQLMNGYCP